MVYDNVGGSPVWPGLPGFAIHKADETEHFVSYAFEVYTDDGRGNGDLICACLDHETALKIAHALDIVRAAMERNKELEKQA